MYLEIILVTLLINVELLRNKFNLLKTVFFVNKVIKRKFTNKNQKT